MYVGAHVKVNRSGRPPTPNWTARPQILLWRTALAVRGQPAGLADSAGTRRHTAHRTRFLPEASSLRA